MCARYFSEFVNKQLLFRKCSHMGKVNDLFVQASVEIVRKLLRNINKHGFKFQILNPTFVCSNYEIQLFKSKKDISKDSLKHNLKVLAKP